jgi:hypothetical protein
MKRDWYTLATWLMWLALPITWFNYRRVWDRLPMRMAVHFDANWQPNGWTSREGALYLGLGIIAFLLVVFTVAAYAVRTNKPSSAWPVMIVFYVALTGLCLLNNWIAQKNLNEQSQPSACLRTEFSGAGNAERLTTERLKGPTAALTRRRYVQWNLEHRSNLDFRWAGSDGHSLSDERNGQALSQSGAARGTHRVRPGRNASCAGARHAGAAHGADLPRPFAGTDVV